VLLVHGTTVIAAWPLKNRPQGRQIDVAVIDDLARLQLAAQRLGFSIRLRHVGPELGALLHLCGLAQVLGAAGPADLSVLEVGGEAEDGEEIGVEEDGQFDDPTT
jgi:hypothetical protein